VLVRQVLQIGTERLIVDVGSAGSDLDTPGRSSVTGVGLRVIAKLCPAATAATMAAF
ncbi:MAG: hypothetical protein HKL89_03105, partial [Candidatus Dormibacteraeota bacterium]|nr:hypothetical protein [Candidatus Dormibacteraeota bacterium]